MTFIFGMAAGTVLALFIFLFVYGANRNNRENEIYIEGFNAGYQSRWGKEESDEPKE